MRTSVALRFLVALCLAMQYPPDAQAATEATVLETQPDDDAVLGRQQSFWVRIQYSSDEPVSLWARPYLSGVEVKQAMSNASLSYQGSGEALGWFALTGAGSVDEVRIKAGGGKPYREWTVSSYPVRLSWTQTPAAEAPQASWVGELLAVEKARSAEAARRRASEPVSGTDVALFSGFMLTVVALFVGAVVVPAWSMWKWRGGWRLAAAVPTALMVVVVARILVDTTRDPTSHNLWPFEILEFGILALAIIGVLKLARRLLNVAT